MSELEKKIIEERIFNLKKALVKKKGLKVYETRITKLDLLRFRLASIRKNTVKLILKSKIFDLKYYEITSATKFNNLKEGIEHYVTNHKYKCANPFLSNARVKVENNFSKYFDIQIPLVKFILCNQEDKQLFYNELFHAEYYTEQARQHLIYFSENPFLHFYLLGDFLGLSPNPIFKSLAYARKYQDLTNKCVPLFRHFINYGGFECRTDDGPFNAEYYVNRYRDVRVSKLSPLDHYLRYGLYEGRAPHQGVKIEAFSNIDINARKNHLNSLLQNNFKLTKKTTKKIEKIKKVERENQKLVKSEENTKLDKRASVIVVAHVLGNMRFGGERSLEDIVFSIDRKNYKVIVVFPHNNEDYFNKFRGKIDHVECFKYGWRDLNTEPDESALNEFKRLINKYDAKIIHVNTIMLREPLLAAKSLGIRSIIHIRELIKSDESLKSVMNIQKLRCFFLQMKEEADFCIFNSNRTSYDYKEVSHKAKLIYNCVSDDLFKLNAPDYYQPRLTASILSSNIEKKGIYDFALLALKCYKRSMPIDFHIYGPETKHLEHVLEKVRVPNLIYKGYVDDPSKAIINSHFVINLSNGFEESFGRTIAEGMAASRCVIGYKYGALPELIDKRCGFIVNVGDIDSIVSNLKYVLRARKSLQLMGIEGRIKAKNHFSRAVLSKKINKLYDKIIQEQHEIKSYDIAYFLWHFPVPSETFVINELRHLVSQNKRVIVFCKNSPYKDFRLDFNIEYQTVKSDDDLAERIKKYNVKIVHSHFVYPTVTNMVWPACEKAKVPFTFITHAQDIFRYENLKRAKLNEISKSKYCKKILIPGRFHSQFLIEQGVSKEKLYISSQGIESSRYQLKTEITKNRKICVISRFVEKKGIAYLIQAAAQINAQINIYGYGDEQEHYRELISTLNLTNVSLKGKIESQDQLISVLHEHDLLIGPAVRATDGDMDGIPTIYMEAMACGIPVMSTTVSSIGDLIQDRHTGFVLKDHNPETIIEEVKKFYTLDEKEISSVVQNARMLIEDQYEVDHKLNCLFELWEFNQIDLVIVSYNNLDELRVVIQRAIKHTRVQYKIYIVDNNSDQETKDYLKHVSLEERVDVTFLDENVFVGPATNIAIEKGNAPYIVYLCGKEGFALKDGWDKDIIKYMDDNDDVGLAGTLCHSPTYLYGEDYPKGVALFDKFRNKNFAVNNPKRIFKHVQGGLFVLRRKMYEEIGGFSKAVPHNYTDVEYSYYAESCGWELGEIESIMALFIKTRPGLIARLNSNVKIIHPGNLIDENKYELIINNKLKKCEVCEWVGKKFKKKNLCPQCGASENQRVLFKYLMTTVYLNRRLPALFFMIDNKKLVGDLEKHFQCKYIDPKDTLQNEFKIKNNTGAFYLIVIEESAIINMTMAQISEILRVLNKDGQLLVALDKSSKEYFKVFNGLSMNDLEIKKCFRDKRKIVHIFQKAS